MLARGSGYIHYWFRLFMILSWISKRKVCAKHSGAPHIHTFARTLNILSTVYIPRRFVFAAQVWSIETEERTTCSKANITMWGKEQTYLWHLLAFQFHGETQDVLSANGQQLLGLIWQDSCKVTWHWRSIKHELRLLTGPTILVQCGKAEDTTKLNTQIPKPPSFLCLWCETFALLQPTNNSFSDGPLIVQDKVSLQMSHSCCRQWAMWHSAEYFWVLILHPGTCQMWWIGRLPAKIGN